MRPKAARKRSGGKGEPPRAPPRTTEPARARFPFPRFRKPRPIRALRVRPRGKRTRPGDPVNLKEQASRPRTQNPDPAKRNTNRFCATQRHPPGEKQSINPVQTYECESMRVGVSLWVDSMDKGASEMFDLTRGTRRTG